MKEEGNPESINFLFFMLIHNYKRVPVMFYYRVKAVSDVPTRLLPFLIHIVCERLFHYHFSCGFTRFHHVDSGSHIHSEG